MTNINNVITDKFIKKNVVTQIGEYLVIDVFEKVDAPLSRAIQKVFLKYRALPKNEDWPKRTKETTLLIIDKHKNIVGLTSSFILPLEKIYFNIKTSYAKPTDLFYCYRLYTIPTVNIPTAPKILTCETFDILRKKGSKKAKGFITPLDNPKLNRDGITNLFKRYKYDILVEKTPTGKTVAARKFSAGKINLPKQKILLSDFFKH